MEEFKKFFLDEAAGKFEKDFMGIGGLASFYQFLDLPAKKAVSVKGGDVNQFDIVREKIARLNKMYDAVMAGSNKSRLISDKFLTNLFDFLSALVEAVEADVPELVYIVSWPKVLKYVYENGTRFTTPNPQPGFGQRHAAKFIEQLKVKDLKTLRGKSEFKATVKKALEAFAPRVEEASDGQYKVILPGRQRSTPILVDTVNELIITARNYNEWLGFTKAADVQEFITMVKNTFDNQYGKTVGSNTIPYGTRFNYNSDAIVACDYSKLIGKGGSYIAPVEAGTFRLDKDTVLHFVHHGLSLKSRTDMIKGINLGEDESRYWNEFSKDGKTLTIGLNTNERFDSIYLDKNAKHYVFEININDGSREYIAHGVYQYESDDAEENGGKPEEITYGLVSADIPRKSGVAAVEESFKVNKALRLLVESGYIVSK